MKPCCQLFILHLTTQEFKWKLLTKTGRVTKTSLKVHGLPWGKIQNVSMTQRLEGTSQTGRQERATQEEGERKDTREWRDRYF